VGCQSYCPFESYYLHDFNCFFLKLRRFNTFQFAHAYARGEGMKHYINMVQETEFAARVRLMPTPPCRDSRDCQGPRLS